MQSVQCTAGPTATAPVRAQQV